MAPQNANSGTYHRKLRPRRTESNSNKMPIVYPNIDTVFAIPELLGLITNYLTPADQRILIRVCRTWNSYWVPYLYSSLKFVKYKRSRIYPKLEVYGPYVKVARIFYTTLNNIIHILDYATNIQSLDLRADLAKSRFPQIFAMVPQLRVLRISQGVYRSETHCVRISPAAALSNLEELTLEGHSRLEVRIDDIMFVIKSCRKLATLSLESISIVEELQDVNSTAEPEEDLVDMVKVDETGWESASLRSLRCRHVLLDRPDSIHDSQTHVHPCIRRLFQHAPNLTSIEFSGKSILCAVDWEYIFESRSGLQNAEFWAPAPFHPFHRGGPLDPSAAVKALGALEKSCHMLKVLNVGSIRPTTDEAFEKIIKVNHQLEKIDAKFTEFGELALKELVRILPHSLVELNLGGCLKVKSSGIAMVLENCERLRVLNLFDTDAGTINLFRGNKPWVCAKSLQKLCISIQPLNHQTVHNNIPWKWEAVAENNNTLYTEEEEKIIRDRLRCFTSLLELDLEGKAMSIGIMDDVSFAPRLRSAILNVPPRSLDGNQSLGGHYVDAQKQAVKWGQGVFPNWNVKASRSYRNGHIWRIEAIRD
ncbi:hypothetical protein BGZ80_011397 [Entomortierella chlamydospora]|uniref:F-box domain-containing protein n=1 Tax=Entomortierella chlamydospora TaxID=101097 RepID=A0A9P6MU86_9FUNG|nr:hypothetical protein BGZ80_011397 [Entomortierella chlamydospora]